MPKQLSVKNFVKPLLLILVLIGLPAEAIPETQQHLKADFMFNNANLKSVLMTMADQMKLNLIFDGSVNFAPIKFERKNISMREAFDKLLVQEKLASLPFDRNIILVFEDTPEVVQRVQEATIWTITNLKQAKGKHEPATNDDWLKMLKESGRKDSFRNYDMKKESLKVAIANLAKQLDYVVMFDDSIKDAKFDLKLARTTPINAVENVFTTQKLRARILDERTIVVFAETDDKYEKLAFWTASFRTGN